MKLKNLKLGIKGKILIPVLLISAIVCGSMGTFMAHRMRNTTTELAAEQALMAARFASTSVAAADLVGLVPGDEGGEQFQRAATALDHARNQVGILYAYTLTTDGTNVYYGVDADREEAIGSVFEEDYAFLSPAFAGEEILDKTIYYTEDGILISCYVPIRDQSGTVISIMGCDYNASEIASILSRNTLLVVLISLLGIVILAAVSILVISYVMRPLKITMRIAKRVRNCDLEKGPPINYSNDELGELTRAFITLADELREIIYDIRQQLTEMSQGNFCVESVCPELYRGTYIEIQDALSHIRDGLNRTLTQIGESSAQVSAGTEQISLGAQNLSESNVNQAGSVEELSQAISNISEQTTITAQRAQEAVTLSREAGVCVKESNEYMQKFAIAMQEINEQSQQIRNIIQTIDSIAFQTNILALNAAVEAARAGSAGKGFSVVADEVRNLAQKSAEAAKNTAELIERTTDSIEHSARLAQQTEQSLREVAAKSAQTEAFVLEISEACTQQASSAELINQNISDINSIVHANCALAEETAATCEELSSQTMAMDHQIQRFNLKR